MRDYADTLASKLGIAAIDQDAQVEDSPTRASYAVFFFTSVTSVTMLNGSEPICTVPALCFWDCVYFCVPGCLLALQLCCCSGACAQRYTIQIVFSAGTMFSQLLVQTLKISLSAATVKILHLATTIERMRALTSL